MRFFFVHFPKAGGTSLALQLKRQFSANVVSDYDHDPIARSDARLEALLPEGVQGVYGHLHPLRYHKWSEVMFTLLRDPVENIISIYFFWKSLPPSGVRVHERFLQENPTLIDFAKYYPVKNLMSEVYFGGFDMNCFDFVGFHESRHSAFNVFSNLLGVPLRPEYHVNKTTGRLNKIRKIFLQDESLILALRDILRDDVKFYEDMRAKWA